MKKKITVKCKSCGKTECYPLNKVKKDGIIQCLYCEAEIKL